MYKIFVHQEFKQRSCSIPIFDFQKGPSPNLTKKLAYNPMTTKYEGVNLKYWFNLFFITSNKI